MPVADNGICPPKVKKDEAKIGENVKAALQLVENYRIAYGCASGRLANGRQLFEVPAALALAGGTAAAAFGAGPGAAIGTGAAAATLGHGNSYYAPKQKARIVAAAHDAVVCIKQEASGVTAMTIEASEKKKAALQSVSFSPEFQYFQQVSSALQNIGAILADRLSSVGSYAPDAIAKEIVTLAKEAEEAKSNPAKKDAEATAKSLTSNGSADETIVNGIVELAELQPRLKLCVLRAKAG
ncbi:hypothetical protein [Rhizorhabdus dicambivorans]|uniref:Uncharacterized protein n=1 Tax=Rhizorhabdus dicambivorans TaxID=1850238 RepID=A0A2A4FZM2_9SPHN|nr:hypothetical protein [Rhizorhabdus dicambivorans]ATE63006.1 hypothetical protein CMV14_00170 [Rhizorhabdus dicambivorans]PCE43183.1 hypothetical protein COO09_05205 [Rhizorhabdus dicambivorans]